jgi:hypothetical protein
MLMNTGLALLVQTPDKSSTFGRIMLRSRMNLSELCLLPAKFNALDSSCKHKIDSILCKASTIMMVARVSEIPKRFKVTHKSFEISNSGMRSMYRDARPFNTSKNTH